MRAQLLAFAQGGLADQAPFLSNRHLATCSADKTIKIWSTENFEFKLERVLEGHQRWVWDCAYSADSAYLVTGTRALSRSNVHPCSLTDKLSSSVSAASSDHVARLWELATGETVRQYNGHHRCVAPSAGLSVAKLVLTDGRLVSAAPASRSRSTTSTLVDRLHCHQAGPTSCTACWQRRSLAAAAWARKLSPRPHMSPDRLVAGRLRVSAATSRAPSRGREGREDSCEDWTEFATTRLAMARPRWEGASSDRARPEAARPCSRARLGQASNDPFPGGDSSDEALDTVGWVLIG